MDLQWRDGMDGGMRLQVALVALAVLLTVAAWVPFVGAFALGG